MKEYQQSYEKNVRQGNFEMRLLTSAFLQGLLRGPYRGEIEITLHRRLIGVVPKEDADVSSIREPVEVVEDVGEDDQEMEALSGTGGGGTMAVMQAEVMTSSLAMQAAYGLDDSGSAPLQLSNGLSARDPKQLEGVLGGDRSDGTRP